MTDRIFSGTQKSISYIKMGNPGDQAGLPQEWLPTQDYLAATDLAIASGCFGINGTNTVQQGYTDSSTPFAGFVIRNQNTIIPFASTLQGFGFTVPQGQQADVQRKGNLIMFITTSFNAGDVINFQDTVYVNKTDGTLAVGVTDQAEYIETDWIVTNTGFSNTVVDNQVVISNTNQFLGQ